MDSLRLCDASLPEVTHFFGYKTVSVLLDEEEPDGHEDANDGKR
jgi:hypothetical protein